MSRPPGSIPVSRVELWRLIAEEVLQGLRSRWRRRISMRRSAPAVTVLDSGRVLAVGTRDEVMAAMPGSISAPDRPSVPDPIVAPGRCGSRMASGRADGPSTGSRPVGRDLEFEDAVIARLLDVTRTDHGSPMASA